MEKSFVAATDGGLTNQRICVLGPMELARRSQCTFVIPSFIGDKKTEIKFSDLYSVEYLKQYADSLNFTVTDDLPQDLASSCNSDLFNNTCPSYVAGQIQDFHERAQRGVICLPSHCSLYFIGAGSEALDLVRPGLKASFFYQNQAANLLAKLSTVGNGADSYVTVHVRVEADFEAHCKGKKLGKSGHSCWAAEHDICNFLLSQLPKSSLLFIASGHRKEALLSLCGNFTCFDKHTLGYEPSPHLIINAFIDWLLALRGKAFYGNMYSTFSREMVAEFRSKRLGPSAYYNFKNPHVPENRK